MIRLYFWIILFTHGVFAQENIYRSVASTLKECYENKYLLEKDNRVPHTLNRLIGILQKIEDSPELKMKDLRTLVVGIMHRFRQDGIERNPTVVEQSGVLPYRAAGQAQKYVVISRFIPEKNDNLPYNILTDIERCSLHFMLSSSIEIFERGDENTVCRFTDNAYRRARSATGSHSNKNLDVHDDVETLTPEQIDVITSNKNGVTEHVFDPNALYPELPPNHPKVARFLNLPPISKCPVENGVIKTTWGPVSAGPLIAGIAAGLQPENVKLSEVFPDEKNEERKANLSRLSLDNKWMATIAGDLAEVTLLQGPINEKLSIGVNGMWNSSALPRWYFLKSNEKLQFTTAEIRGDIDGLILANEIEALYSKVPQLRLSQILDLYYSPRGLFNPSISACNRKTLFHTVIPKPTMSAQAYSASLVLEEHLHRATINDVRMQEFAAEATDELFRYVDSMNTDLTCQETNAGIFNDIVQVAIDLTIILDTTWPFDAIQPIIANILENLKINRHNSQFTIINGHDGGIMINTTNSILDFDYYYYVTHFMNVTSGFDLPKTFDKLRALQTKKLNDERSSLGQAKSDVVLIIPYTSTLSNSDKDYCTEKIKQMREKVPDTTLLILTYGSKDRWADLVRDSVNDLYSTTAMDDIGGSKTIATLTSRIKQVPQRLINTQCGADYSPAGSTNTFFDFIEPGTMIFYRMHPNYFFSTNSAHEAKIKIEGSGWGSLKICTSRHLDVNISTSSKCESITNNAHTVAYGCGDAGLIHLCDPLYLTIIANSSITNYQCNEPGCRFPHMIKYTVSYENLVCENSASINILNISVLIISMIYTFL